MKTNTNTEASPANPTKTGGGSNSSDLLAVMGLELPIIKNLGCENGTEYFLAAHPNAPAIATRKMLICPSVSGEVDMPDVIRDKAILEMAKWMKSHPDYPANAKNS